MNKKDQLFEIADRQRGVFTATQAVECGYARPNFHLKIASGEWVQERRGIYRLGRYPFVERPELVLWSLWSRNIHDIPQGVWSHETALDIHELSDVMPSKMHMTVPMNFRRRSEVPKVLSLHHALLEEKDIEQRQGFRVTTPLRTLIDIVKIGTVADNFLIQALQQALDRGMILKEELRNLEKSCPDVYLKLKHFDQ